MVRFFTWEKYTASARPDRNNVEPCTAMIRSSLEYARQMWHTRQERADFHTLESMRPGARPAIQIAMHDLLVQMIRE